MSDCTIRSGSKLYRTIGEVRIVSNENGRFTEEPTASLKVFDGVVHQLWRITPMDREGRYISQHTGWRPVPVETST